MAKKTSIASSESAAPADQQEVDFNTLERRRREQRLDGLKIVVVEDTPDARNLISRYLSNAGASVYAAASAKEARELLERFEPDATISDIGMPDEDGISFIETLRDSEKSLGVHVPAIALTAFIGLEHRSLTFRAGFDEHLCKPVAPETLIDAILRVILNDRSAVH